MIDKQQASLSPQLRQKLVNKVSLQLSGGAKVDFESCQEQGADGLDVVLNSLSALATLEGDSGDSDGLDSNHYRSYVIRALHNFCH